MIHCIQSAFVRVTQSLQAPLDKNKSRATDDDQPVYFAGLDVVPSSERRLVSAASVMLDFTTLNTLHIVPYRYPYYIRCFPESSKKCCNTGGRLVRYSGIYVPRFLCSFFATGFRVNRV